MKKSKIIKWTWKCKKCDDIKESFSNERHNLDTCKCDASSVDLEEFYCRQLGEVEVINIEECD